MLHTKFTRMVRVLGLVWKTVAGRQFAGPVFVTHPMGHFLENGSVPVKRRASFSPIWSFAVGWIFLLALALPASGQLSTQQRDQLVERIRVASENLDGDKITEIEDAAETLQLAIDELKNHLSRKADAANAQAWLDYLAVMELREATEEFNDKPSRDSLKAFFAAAQTVRDRTIGVQPGLEVTAVRAVRSAVADLVPAVRFRSKEATLAYLEKQLVALAESWEGIEGVPTPEESARLSGILSLLNETGQRDGLIDEAGRQFSHPNISIWIGEQLVQRALSRSVNQSRPVRDCILGTSITGTALLTGQVSAQLLPTDGAIRVQVTLDGQVHSNNIGRNGPVRLRTSGLGNVSSSRVVTVNESGIYAEPVQTTGTLSTRINAIEHRLRLVRRIARKKAGEQKPLADRIALGKLKDQVGSGFAEETDEALSRPLPNPTKQLLPWFLRLDLPTPTRRIGSTQTAVYAHATVRRSAELAAPLPAPAVPGGYDAVIQVHESLIDNTVGHMLAGRTVNEDELAELLQQSGRATKIEREEGEEPFELDFARSRPIVFEAREGKIRVGIRGTRFQQGNKGIDKAVEITATYEPITTVEGYVILKLVEDAKIDFPGTKRLSVSQTGTRTAMTKKFKGVFPKYLMDQPWTVPSTVQSEAIRNRVYRPRQFHAEDGWVTIAIN